MADVPIEELIAGEPADREAAAREIRKIATTGPGRLCGSLEQLVKALNDDCEPVRRYVVNAFCEVASADPTAIGPIAERLVACLEDESTAVRIGVARTLAELAAVEPQRVCFAVPDLVSALTDTKRVRHMAARILDSLAPRFPERLSKHADTLTRTLLDEYHPVQTRLLSVVTVLERTDPGLLDGVTQRLRELSESDIAAVRQASCRAIAANDPPYAKTVLTDRARTDSHPVVRETAREALARRSAEKKHEHKHKHKHRYRHKHKHKQDRPVVNADEQAVFTQTTLGDWVAIDAGQTQDVGLRFLVGRLTVITRAPSSDDEKREQAYGLHRAAFDTRQEWLAAPQITPTGDRQTVHLHNPFTGYGVNLVGIAETIGIEYTDPDRPFPSLSQPERLMTVSPDRARLLAATVGDTLSFALEGTTHEITITRLTDDEKRAYRVTGRNEEHGYQITFRPLSTDPMMAVFEKGRAFRATDLCLKDL